MFRTLRKEEIPGVEISTFQAPTSLAFVLSRKFGLVAERIAATCVLITATYMEEYASTCYNTCHKQAIYGTDMARYQAPPDKFSPGWLDQLDGRTGIAQAMRQRYASFTNDLGGDDRLSYQQRVLVERALWLEYYLHTQEKAMASGEAEFEPGKYTQSVNALSGLLTKLGLDRMAREVSFTDYVKGTA